MAKKLPATPRNPFEIGLLAHDDHFADREQEVARIVRAFREPGTRLVVFGDRRLGKSSALDRAAAAARKAGQKVAVASFATATDPADAAQQLLGAVRHEIGRNWRETMERIAERLQATMELRPGTAAGLPPSVRFAFGLREESDARPRLLWDVLGAIDAQMEAQRITLGIGIDEFQRIHEWGGEDAEWALKSAMETHRNLSYVLAGSKRHLIEAMLTNKGRALWKQVDRLDFGSIAPDVLAEWITRRAARTGVTVPLALADRIVALAQPRTRDVVQLARVVWDSAIRAGRADDGAAEAALDQLVREEGALYDALWRTLQKIEQRILRAIAAEPGIAILAADVLARYRLGAKSTVSSALSRLLEREVLARDATGAYTFDDPFFRRWVQVNALPDLGLPPGPLPPG
ncbi:MAG TPA: hypothetical protein VF092_18850 [Longimicrobium sp.]